MNKSQKNEQHCIKQNEKSFIQKDLYLTELWQKGELKEGHYYVRDGENIIAELLDGYFYNNGEPMTSFSGGVDKVLAPVPSYSEYLALQSDSLAKNEAVEINAELEHRLAMVKANGNYPDRISRLKSRVVALSEENQKLKELLKEVLCHELSLKEISELTRKITQVLGEE